MAVSKKARALYWAVFIFLALCLEYAYGYNTGKKFDKHPQGLIFAGYTVPFYDNAVELVTKAHPTIAHFRLVSWDIAIGEKVRLF